MERITFTIFRSVTFFAIGILVLVFLLIFISGHSVIDWQFISSDWNHIDITQGGIFPAIVGSFYIGVGVIVLTFILGIGTAIYLTEFNNNTTFKGIIELTIRNLAGIPSVVFGMFGLAVFVGFFDFGTSILSATLTLSAMTLPWIITSSIESLKSIPSKFRDSSLALGATKWQTTVKVILPAAIPGSITGSILSLSRALGETAPIIMVGATFFLSDLPTSVFDKFMALPYHTFILSTQHSSPFAKEYAAATSLILISLTFILSLSSTLLRTYFRSKKDW